MKKTILISAVILFSTGLAFCQSAGYQDILSKVNNRYSRASSLNCTFICKLYADNNTTVPSETMDCTLEMVGSNVRYRAGKTTVIRNKNYQFTVNSDQKYISISKPDKNLPVQASFSYVDSSFYKMAIITMSKTTNGNYAIEYNYKKIMSDFDRVILFIAPDFRINKIVYYFRLTSEAMGYTGNTKPRLEIQYINQVFNTDISANIFNDKKYFTVIHGNIQPTNTYSNYKIYNLL